MSLKKIAAMVGTSVSTVSRTLNNTSPACASKELQDRIWAAAREINYIPNEAARSLRNPGQSTVKSFHISIVLARITELDEEPFFSELFRNLETELFRQHATIDHVVYAEKSMTQDLSRSDGIIILGRCSHELLDHITSQNRSVIGIWRNPQNFNVDEVVCDGKKAAEMAMNHLFSLGHRRIAYIGDCSFESRYVGYCDMLIKNNIPMDYELIKQTNQTRAEAEDALTSLLEKKRQSPESFSAILCANDNTAIRVLELLQKEKQLLRQNPISVISIDDIEEAQNTKPYLTTVHIPRQEMAHMAILLLLDRISRGHDQILRTEFPCSIVQRSSCYPVPRP